MIKKPLSIPILMYHQIRESDKNEKMKSLCVSPKSFARQMRLLKLLGYKGLSIRELTPYLTGKKTGKVFGITFDDGYLNNLQNAAPLLQSLSYSSTCYIVSGLLGSTNKWDQELGVTQVPLMNKLEINRWISLGQDIGCHTSTHPDITSCSTNNLEIEIKQSKEALEHEFGIDVEDFCYPYGFYSEREKDAVKKYGFKTATTTSRSRAHEKDNLLELPRVHIFRSTRLHLFMLKVLSQYEDKRRQ